LPQASRHTPQNCFSKRFQEEAKGKEGTARKALGLLPLDSASSDFQGDREAVAMRDDSGQALDLPPNRCGFSYRGDFGGE
jgi:hypothetical protein